MPKSKSNSPRVSKPSSIKPNLERLEAREVPAITLSAGVTWNDVGPQVIANGQSSNVAGSNPVNGAVQALAPVPTNANIMFAGSPNGGVWRTTNATSTSPTWTPLGDNLASLSVSDLTLDPADSNRLLVGIGLTADGIAEDTAKDPTRKGLRGDLTGVFLSENALSPNPTFRQIGGTIAGKSITKVVLRGNVIIVGTDQGIFYSGNGGATFTNTFAVTPDNGVTYVNTTFTQKIYDIAQNTRLPNQLYMASGGPNPRVYRSDNGGQAWGDVTDLSLMQFNSRTTNIKITVRDNGQFDNQVYVASTNDNPVQNSGEDFLTSPSGTGPNLPNTTFAYTGRKGGVTSICWSTNQGGNWTRMDAPKQVMATNTFTTLSLVNGVMTVQDADTSRLKTGDVVRLAGLQIPNPNQPPPTLPSPNNGDYFITVVSPTSFSIDGATADWGLAYDPNAGSPVLIAPATWRRLVNGNSGEKTSVVNGNYFDIVADPNDSTRLFFGGDIASPTFYANSNTGPTTFTDTVYSGIRTTNPSSGDKGASAQWSSLVNSGVTSGAAISGDTRTMVFDANGNLWVGTGGGVYRKNSSGGATGVTPAGNTWQNVNGNLKVGQFWQAGLSTASGTIIGATQDTGSVAQSTGGNPTFNSILTTAQRNNLYDQESSYMVAVDNTTLAASNQTIQYFVGKDFSNIIRRVVSSTGAEVSRSLLNFASPTFPTGLGSFLGGLRGSDNPQVAWNGVTNAPQGYILQDPTTIAIGLNLNDRARAVYGRNGVYEDSDPNGITGNIVNDITPSNMTGTVTSFVYGGRRAGINFNQVLYIGTSTGQLQVRGEFGTTFAVRTPPGSGAINQIVRDEDNWQTVYVLRGSRVYQSTNAGLNWTDITGNLVGAVDPVTGGAVAGTLSTEIRTIALWDPQTGVPGGTVLLAGGRGGVFRKSLSNLCLDNAWGPYGQGLPNSIVTDLQFQGDQLTAATFGRGVWYINNVRPTLGSVVTLTVDGTAGDDTLTITADPNIPNNFIISDGVNALSVAAGSVDKVVFNGLGGADRVIIDSNGLAAGGTARFLRANVEANLGGDAGDQLIINSIGDATAENVNVTSDTISGSSFFYSGCVTVKYSGLGAGSLYMNTGTANNVVNIQSVSAANNIFYSGGGNLTTNITATSGNITLANPSGNNRVNASFGSANDAYVFTNTGYSVNGTLGVNYIGNVQNTYITTTTGTHSVTAVGNSSPTNFVVNSTGGYAGTITGLTSVINYGFIQDIGIVGNSANDNLRWLDYTGNTYGSSQNTAGGLVYTPISATAGKLVTASGAVSNVSFNGISGNFSVNGDFAGLGGKDTISVIGTTQAGLPSQYGEILSPDASDTITATDTTASVNNVFFGALKPINFELANTTKSTFTNIFVRGGNGTSTGNNFFGTVTNRTNLVFDGGLPVAPNTISVSQDGTGIITGTNDPAFGPPQRRLTQASNAAALGYFNFPSDPNLPVVPTPPPPPRITLNPTPTWSDAGPSSIINGQVANIAGSNPVNGAISALAPMANNPNVMFAGAPNGGVWRTVNAQAASPTWTPIGDQLGSLSVADLTLDPTNANRLLVGIGQNADGNAEDKALDPTRSGVRGDLTGLYLTENALDAKPNWVQIGGTMIGKNVKNVVLRPGYILVGTDQGIFYSNNNGRTFTNTFAVSNDNGITFQNVTFSQQVFDLAQNPRLPNQFYMATSASAGAPPQVYRSDNGGQSWGNVSDNVQMQLNGRTVNVKLSVRDAASDDNQVYVTVSNNLPVQNSPEDHLIIPPGVDLVYGADAWRTGQGRGQGLFLTYGYTSRNAVVASVCVSTNQGGNWTRLDAPKVEMAPVNIDRISVVNNVLRIKQEPALGSEPTRLKDGDIVLLRDISTTQGPYDVPSEAAFFVRVIDDYTFELVGETATGTIAYSGIPFADTPVSGTWSRLVNANPGEKAQFLDIVANPNNANEVYLGGDSTTAQFWNDPNLGPTTYTDSIWRGTRNVSPGQGSKSFSSQWNSVTYGPAPAMFGDGAGGNPVGSAPGSASAPPSDTRQMVFDASGNLWVATGGGIYRRSNPGSLSSTWNSANGNIKVGQFWNAALSTNSGTVFGGTQDTGAVSQLRGGNPTYTAYVSTTDRNRLFDQESAYVASVDNVSLAATNQSIQYVAGKDFNAIYRRIINADGTIASQTKLRFTAPITQNAIMSGIDPTDQYAGITDTDPTNDPLQKPLTIAMTVNNNDPQRAVYGRLRVYEDSLSSPTTGAVVNDVTPVSSSNVSLLTGNVTAFSYGGVRAGTRYNQVLYFGTSSGQLFARGEFGTSFANNPVPGSGGITDIVQDSTDWRKVFVLRGGRVYYTTNAGVSFVDVTANLVGAVDPNTGGPVVGTLSTEIRTIALWRANPNDPSTPEVLVAGGRGGVFRKLVNPVTVGTDLWREYGEGLPETVVTDLRFAGNQFTAATFGRGVWYINDVSSTLPGGVTVTVTGTSAGDFITVSADPDRPNNFIVSDGVNAQSFDSTVVDSLVINTLGGADTVLIDSNALASGGNVRFLRTNVSVNMGGDAGDRLIINGETDALNEVVNIDANSVSGTNFFYSDPVTGIGNTIVNYAGLEKGQLYVNMGLTPNNLANISGLSASSTIVAANGPNAQALVSATSGNLTLRMAGGTNNRVSAFGTSGSDNFAFTNNGYTLNGALNVAYLGAVQNSYVNTLGSNNNVTLVGQVPQSNFVVNSTGFFAGSATGLTNTVNFTNIQNVGVVGGSGKDTLRWLDYSKSAYGTATNPTAGHVYIPQGPTSGKLIASGGAVTGVTFTNLNGTFSVNGDFAANGNRDTITVAAPTQSGLVSRFGEIISPDAADGIAVSDTSVQVTNPFFGTLKPLTMELTNATTSSFANVIVRGGDNNGSQGGNNFLSSVSKRTNLLLDGGNTISNNPLTQSLNTLSVSYVGNRTITPDGTLGTTGKRLTQTSDNSSVGYINFNGDPPAPPPGPVPPTPPKPADIFAVGSEAGVPATVKVYNAQTGALKFQLQPFGPGFTGGARVATGDVNGDGTQDFVVAAGPGGGPRVIAYNGNTGVAIKDFLAFPSSMTAGMYVAVADVNNNGFADIIVGTGAGVATQVNVFDGSNFGFIKTFAPYSSGFTGGVRVAAGDVNGDGKADIITGAGPGGGPHVQVFDVSTATTKVIQSFMAYDPSFSVGIYVAAGDVDGDGKADIITGPDVGGSAQVQVFQAMTGTMIRGFFVGEPTVPNQQPITVGSGVRVAALDIDGDGVVEILTGRGKGVKPLAQVIKVSSRNPVTGVVTPTLSTPLAVNVFGDSYLDGIFVG